MIDVLREHIDGIGLVDHHVHGTFRGPLERSVFENALNEADTAPIPAGSRVWDSQVGFAIRRWCAEPLDLPRHVSPDEYWARRSELGDAEVTRRLLHAAGVRDWIVDTGFAATGILTPRELADVAGDRAREITRLEPLAEELIADGADGYAARFAAALAERVATTGSVGVKSVIAYRSGFDVDLARPTEAAVATAARRWYDAIGGAGGRHDAIGGAGGRHDTVGDAGSRNAETVELHGLSDPGEVASADSGAGRVDQVARLIDPVLLVHGLYAAIDLGFPLQIHVGFGDRDLDLHRVNPLLLLDFLRTPGVADVSVLLLHCYPYEREAGYLAQAFSNVYLDVGLATHFIGARSSAIIARSFELAPFEKLLYSSDGYGPAELHYLGARLWREGMARVLSDWVETDQWSLTDAMRVADMVGRVNAERVYRLSPS